MKVRNAYHYGKSEFSSFLQGKHNRYNINAAAIACKIIGISPKNVVAGVADFEPLPHRLQFVGEFNEIKFYNDSISTIPQATIAALQAVPKVQTLILGGFDRGIDYTVLTDYLVENPVENIILIGEAGKRIRHIWVKMLIENPKHKKLNINFFDADNYSDVVDIAKRHTSKGKVVLLSPAAASYDMFKNFEHRGNVFMELVKKSVIL
jgi:UDP-N-acetylmuramoylalanine--D-glutamate ligase